MLENELIVSQDGAHTIRSAKFGVNYHSKYGAIQETETVFIKPGFEYKVAQGLTNISILEMGFGSGLNALMTLVHEIAPSVNIDYHTLEAYPITEEQAHRLNYPSLLNISEDYKSQFHKMHKVSSGKKLRLNHGFTFTKYIEKLEDFQTDMHFDIIYFDAFAPNTQEHLWSESMMKKMYSLTNQNGILNTYCAKGVFKRALKSVGYEVEGLPGPIGKREITRAKRPL